AGLLGKDCTPSVVIEVTTVSTAITTSTVSTTTISPGPWSDVRLPTYLVPYHYVVDLQPNLEPDSTGKYWFNGTSEVQFQVANSTRFIYIHSNKLEYDDVYLADESGAAISIAQWWLYDMNQFLIVELDAELVQGQNYSLHTQFKGELADDLTGLYRSTYTDINGKDVIIAISQMQPTDARKSFPCFDEPAFKATFKIFLWHKDPNYALSNMPFVITEERYGGWKRTEFEPTLRMSTYLLAFVVSEFGYEQSFTSGTPPTRIYARPEQVLNHNVEYAKNITPVILDYYESYFGNWGLVMYRETALLFDAAINSAYSKQRVARVIAHELSHQWFGDLITPLWWDELWLNEGFATFIEYIGTDYVEPGFRMMDQFVLYDLHDALTVDALTTSRPIIAENVTTPDDINALFDDISYSKGGCFIRMISEFAGEEAFKLGLKNYLEEFSYGLVDHNQLFSYWEEAILATNPKNNPPENFKADMDTWVNQMGYPVVTMKQNLDNPLMMEVLQERFLLDPKADPTLPESPYKKETGDLLIKAITAGHFSFDILYDIIIFYSYLLNNSDLSMVYPNGKYVIGNYEAFVGLIKFQAINVKSRSQIIDDALTLARFVKICYEIALKTTKFLRDDYDFLPWQSALRVLSYLDDMLGRSEAYELMVPSGIVALKYTVDSDVFIFAEMNYDSYLLYLVEPAYYNLTWTDEGDHLQRQQRGSTINTACSYGSIDCIEHAQTLFHTWMADPSNNTISPNLRDAVYCQAVANGGSDEWDFIWGRYQTEGDSHEKSALQSALACTKQLWIIQRYLEYTLDSTLVRNQDAYSVYVGLCGNDYARDLTWDFLRREWDYIYEVYGSGFFRINSIIEGCTSRFSTEFELKELETFKESRSDQLGTGARSVDQALELTKTNIQWRTDYEDTVFSWLNETMS
uniref:Aminopeptidase n=1 Tax=Ciona savignyi TaxID=51511 RepID=H2Y8Z8_CIOSA